MGADTTVIDHRPRGSSARERSDGLPGRAARRLLFSKFIRAPRSIATALIVAIIAVAGRRYFPTSPSFLIGASPVLLRAA